MDQNSTYKLTTGTSFQREDDTAHRDDLFALWSKFWLNVYQSQGSTYVPSPLDFQRLTFILSIHGNDGRPYGMMGMNFFDFGSSCSKSAPYITSFYDDPFFSALKSRGKQYVFSCEFLSSFAPKSEKRSMISMTRLMGHGMEVVARMCGADALICTARADNGVSQICQRIGYEVVTPDVERRNFKCDLLVHPLNPIPDFLTKDMPEFTAKLTMSKSAETLIRHFWNSYPSEQKVAA